MQIQNSKTDDRFSCESRLLRSICNIHCRIPKQTEVDPERPEHSKSKAQLARMKLVFWLAIFLCWTVQESAARSVRDNSKEEEYSAFDSASWAITSSNLSPLLGTDKQDLYNDFIKGCDAAVEEKEGRSAFCTFGERSRFEMNALQPSSCYNYTKAGYAKTKAPPELYAEIKEYFDANRDNSRIEWKDITVYHNTWDSPPTFIDLQKNMGLTRRIERVVQPILEEWTGQKLRPVSSYGIRLYHNNSILTPHVDRMPLVTSVISKCFLFIAQRSINLLSVENLRIFPTFHFGNIVQVDQDVDEPWPLEVYGHDGTATNVTMEPGDMVLYESHSVIHGRPFPMRGNYFANCFIHYEPIEPLEGESLYDPALDIPPYLIPDSKWMFKWKQMYPDGWKQVSSFVYSAIHLANFLF